MKAFKWWIVVLTIFLSCRALACNTLPEDLLSAVRQNKIILVGELHGTVEGPKHFFDIVCNTVGTFPDLTIGLELSPVEGISLNDIESFNKWLSLDTEWKGPHDGRTSQAKYQLISNLIRLKSEYPNISILLFNRIVEQRDLAMANVVADAYHGQKMVIYSGSAHSRLTKGAPWDENWEPMGYFLKKKLPINFYSILLVFNGGTAWNWQDTIGVHPLDMVTEPLVNNTKVLDETAPFNIIWNVGAGTASLPQFPDTK